MKQIGWLISRYLVQAILPYFAFAWLILSVILFVQQAGRFSDIFFSVNIPSNLIWQLTIALFPNVIAFTCPMAMLVGTVIGLSRMQGDSELVAIRAAGVGNLQVAVPIVLLGICLSVFAFVVNLRGVPLAASLVRNVAVQTAIHKLESPIEPGVFNSEIAGYTVYVKDGDIESGRWRNLFIYQQVPGSGDVRLITSGQGRIDVTDQLSELVLENATVSTIPADTAKGKFASENIGEIRLAIKTRRSELIEKLSSHDSVPEELGLSELSTYARSKDGKDRIEAELIWQRRITLSISPLIFCLLGTAMVLRFNRSGRGFGVFLSLVGLVGYFLLAFFGEQLARTGRISVVVSGLFPVVGSLVAILWLSLSRRIEFLSGWSEYISGWLLAFHKPKEKLQSRNLFVDVTTGLGDFDLITGLLRYFLLTVAFLLAISAIFTAFELWRFAGTIDGGVWLLTKYLFFLVPFLYLYFAPSAAMIGTLATYVIKSRQNEIVTWISAGKSVYRLLAPCFLLMIVLGFVNWQIQERLAPASNLRQDALRNQIRKGGVTANSSGKFWVANDKRIYSFELESATPVSLSLDPKVETESPGTFASDNEKRVPFVPDTPGKADPALHGSADAAITAGTNAGLPFAKTCRGCETVRADNAVIGSGPERKMPEKLRENESGTLSGIHASDNGRDWPGIAPSTSRFNLAFAGVAGSPLLVALGASDNENAASLCPSGATCVRNIAVYEFNTGGEARLQSVYQAASGRFENGGVVLSGKVDRMDLREGRITNQTTAGLTIAENENPFSEILAKPNHMTVAEIGSRIGASESDVERRSFAVALQKRYVTLFLPLVIGLFTAPFSLSLNRKGRVVTVGYAVGLWLLYTGVTSAFEQMGLSGFLTPSMAVWSPVVIFSMLGVYLLSRIRT